MSHCAQEHLCDTNRHEQKGTVRHIICTGAGYNNICDHTLDIKVADIILLQLSFQPKMLSLQLKKVHCICYTYMRFNFCCNCVWTKAKRDYDKLSVKTDLPCVRRNGFVMGRPSTQHWFPHGYKVMQPALFSM